MPAIMAGNVPEEMIESCMHHAAAGRNTVIVPKPECKKIEDRKLEERA